MINYNDQNDIIFKTFGMPRHDLIQLIDKYKEKAEKQKVSSMKYYNKMKGDDTLKQKQLESKKKYYHKNKERLNQYYKDKIANDEDAKEKYNQSRKEWYERNKHEILEKQRSIYHETNKDKIILKRGRKPKNITPSDDDTTTASDGSNHQ